MGLERGATLPDHAFGWGQLVYARDGVGRVEAEASVWVLPTGRALWAPPGVRHALHCITRVELSSLFFPPDRLPDLPDRCLVIAVSPLLRALIDRLADNVPVAGDPRAERWVAVVYDELAAAPAEALTLPLPADPRARALADRLMADPGTDLSLDALSADCGASRRTMERLFRAETGTSVGAWQRMARMQHAVILLGEGTAVGEVADAVGYGSASAFVAAFRRAFGTTPGRF